MNNEEKILELLTGMQGQMDRMEGQMDRMEGRMDSMEGQMDRMEGRMDSMEGRLDRMEGQMGSMEGRIGSLEKNVSGIRMDIENRIDPTLQMLAEGQAAILEKVAPKTRVEALEDKVDFLETVVRRITRDVEDLKKAQ